MSVQQRNENEGLRAAAQRVVDSVEVAHTFDCRSLTPPAHGAFCHPCDCEAPAAVEGLRIVLGVLGSQERP